MVIVLIIHSHLYRSLIHISTCLIHSSLSNSTSENVYVNHLYVTTQRELHLSYIHTYPHTTPHHTHTRIRTHSCKPVTYTTLSQCHSVHVALPTNPYPPLSPPLHNQNGPPPTVSNALHSRQSKLKTYTTTNSSPCSIKLVVKVLSYRRWIPRS
jgi:hypothetical protein